MILKHVALFLNLDDYPREFRSDFGFQTRYLCNFLERRLRPARFLAEGFSKICVQGKHVPEEICPIVPENALRVPVPFDEQRYESLGPNEHHEFFIAMLTEGLKKCAKQHRIPLDLLLASIDEFRRGGYRNEWVHRSKLLRGSGLRASLLYSLDVDRFTLTLELTRRGQEVFNEQILETKPDEIIFAHRFKDVVLDNGDIVVRDEFGEPTFSLALESLG